ncbi:uncharacterized protein LOC109811669 [Cajanus cajan]|uniref:uncharacterized protein LOC109794100 n=1 Tax=Cajanus cajan TaxID=3821 RepID=UPI00098D94CB|nr:uncharacterized protein LOC109794100 [Cajanus cajan]XP_020231054.1 uncharacterized protein LOC109811669 [Cajanus cajan]
MVKKEVTKLLQARIINPILDSQWVSPVQVVPKKTGLTIVNNEKDELIPTRVQNSWRIHIALEDKEKKTFTCPFGTFAYRRMLFGLCNAPRTFQRLDRVLNRFIETNFVLNFEKCDFMVKQGIVLGHIISSQGIEVNLAKISVIAQLPYPSYVREVRSFLGHGGFYRCFIKDFSKKALPLSSLLQKYIDFHFDDKCKEAFDFLENALTITPII